MDEEKKENITESENGFPQTQEAQESYAPEESRNAVQKAGFDAAGTDRGEKAPEGNPEMNPEAAPEETSDLTPEETPPAAGRRKGIFGRKTRSAGKPRSDKKKEAGKYFRRGLVTGILCTLAVFIALAAAGALFIMRQYPQVGAYQNGEASEVDNSVGINIPRISDKLNAMQRVISVHFLFQQDPQTCEDAIYHAFMDSLDDPYSVYYNSDEYASMMEDSEGRYGGIGALVSQDPETKDCYIVSVYDGSPAKEAGLLPDDIIYKVDGVDMTGMDLDLVVADYVRGEENTTFIMTVLRGEERQEVDIRLTRKLLDYPYVEYEMLDDKVGYISVLQFTEATVPQYENALDSLQRQGARKIVLDLRDNPGGLLQACVEMLDYTLPDGLLTYTANKAGQGAKYYSKDGHQVDLPMAILLNENSASASEVFSGAMRDFGWAKLVGTTSFGKGIVQGIYPLGDGTGVKVTEEHYYTPTGYDLHGKGLEPDVAVELDEACKAYCDEKDNQLQAARDALK